MKKKIIIISILAVFMLIAISVVTAASMQTTKSIKEKVSPLFGIRSARAADTEGKIQLFKETIKSRFLNNVIYLRIPTIVNLLKDYSNPSATAHCPPTEVLVSCKISCSK